jgi:hypothetical protein
MTLQDFQEIHQQILAFANQNDIRITVFVNGTKALASERRTGKHYPTDLLNSNYRFYTTPSTPEDIHTLQDIAIIHEFEVHTDNHKATFKQGHRHRLSCVVFGFDEASADINTRYTQIHDNEDILQAFKNLITMELI